MNIQLSDHFSYSKLLRFTFPAIVMMVFTSIYSIVDGFFISNYVGITHFAAVNLIIPLTQILGSIGFMFGTGGSALVSLTLGRKENKKANQIFSMLTYIAFCLGIIFAIIGIIFIKPIAIFMGADENMLPYCIIYGSILLIALPAFILQNMFQSFLITAEKPVMGLIITIMAGITNIILDAIFIIIFKWEVFGAALATALSQFVGGIIPLIYFLRKNNSLLKLGRLYYNGKILFTACTNGMSELITNISMSVVAILYNFQLMRFAGENGVAAYGAIMYIGFIFVAIFLGYSIGVAPVIGFHYGAKSYKELKGLFRKSNVLIITASILLAIIAFFFAELFAKIFASKDISLMSITVRAFHFYAISVLFSGFSIFGSAFFTALNNGVVSALISFLRTLLFQVVTVLILPIFFDLNGVWYSMFLAEILATIVTLIFYITNKKRYNY